MEQNRNAPEARADESASSVNPSAAHATEPHEPAPPEPKGFDFVSPAEEDAYWAGVADGIRNAGGKYPPRLMARARDAYPELVATHEEIVGCASSDPVPGEEQGRPLGAPADLLDFDPVSTRHRVDGWTPAKQREFVEALADSGVVRYAAARVGMSEQSVARLRRQADARSFDLACEAAVRIGARRLRSIAFERAIEGTIKRHYYHGELKSEERVFDNRLLVYLLGKVEKLLEPPERAAKVAENWQPWMDALEAGAEPPVLNEDEGAVLREDEGHVSGERRLRRGRDEFELDDLEDPESEDQDDGLTVWVSEGRWWTGFPPPAGFDGQEDSRPGRPDYRRTLSAAEQAMVDDDLAAMHAEDLAAEIARRDRWFGFEGGTNEPELFRLWEAEPTTTSELSAPSAPAGGEEPAS